MSWKFVFNGQKFENQIEASIAAGKAGYCFFLYEGEVYFRDKIMCRVYETGLQESDLF